MQMSSELREEADVMFPKHQNGEFLYIYRVPILGMMRDVPIVKAARNAEYGFLNVSNVEFMYAYEVQKYQIYTYDDNHLLVVLKERHAQTLEKQEYPGTFQKSAERN